jgi:hypothetical protein
MSEELFCNQFPEHAQAVADMTARAEWRLSSRSAYESETPTGVVLIRLENGAEHELVARSFGAAAHRLKVAPGSITRFAWSRPPANLVQLPARPRWRADGLRAPAGCAPLLNWDCTTGSEWW